MTGKDHPPSTTGSPRIARRALTTSVAVLIAVTAPVGIVSATAGGSETLPPPSTTSSSVLVARLDGIRAQRAVEAELASVVVATPAAEAPVPTTAAPPPPPPAPPPAPVPVVQPVATGGGYNDPNDPAAWDRLARCEANGNWATNTGNGYYGGLQFNLSSWQSVGGPGRPDQASRETQIAMGQRLYHSGGGWSHWPGCTRQLGYR